MSALDDLTTKVRNAVGADSGLGKTVKYDFKGSGFIFIDGGSVSNDDKPADLTLTIAIDDFAALSSGKLSPMSAVMTGKLKMSDMGTAMVLQSKLEALGKRIQG